MTHGRTTELLDCCNVAMACVPLQASGCASLPDKGYGFSRLLDAKMNYFTRVGISLSQLLATTLFGCMPDESFSASCHRRGWKRTERFINWLARDDMHCAKAYISELVGSQNAKEYSNGSR